MRTGVQPGSFPVKFAASAVDLREACIAALVIDVTAESPTIDVTAGASAEELVAVQPYEVILPDGTPLSEATLAQGNVYLASYVGPYNTVKISATGASVLGVALEPRNPEHEPSTVVTV